MYRLLELVDLQPLARSGRAVAQGSRPEKFQLHEARLTMLVTSEPTGLGILGEVRTTSSVDMGYVARGAVTDQDR